MRNLYRKESFRVPVCETSNVERSAPTPVSEPKDQPETLQSEGKVISLLREEKKQLKRKLERREEKLRKYEEVLSKKIQLQRETKVSTCKSKMLERLVKRKTEQHKSSTKKLKSCHPHCCM